MKILVRAAAIALAAAILFPTGIAAAQKGDAKKHGPIAWTESLDAAKKRAAREKKVIMVDFWAEWCGPCKQMLKTTYQDKAVVARSRSFIPVLVNVDKQKDIASKYAIMSIPTVIFMDAKGGVILRADQGYQNAADFLKTMDAAEKRSKS